MFSLFLIYNEMVMGIDLLVDDIYIVVFFFFGVFKTLVKMFSHTRSHSDVSSTCSHVLLYITIFVHPVTE